jgi:hypothetical protein
MLHEFLAANRDAIIARTEATVKLPTLPSPSISELANGATMFLTQVSETLRLEATATPFSSTATGSTARHGGDVLALEFNVSQVVHGYGDICQAITAGLRDLIDSTLSGVRLDAGKDRRRRGESSRGVLRGSLLRGTSPA